MSIRIESVELRASTAQVVEVRYGSRFLYLEKVHTKGIRAYYEYLEENEEVMVNRAVVATVPGEKDNSVPYGPGQRTTLIGVLPGTFGPTFFYDLGAL